MRYCTALLAAIVAATAFAQGVIDVHSHLISPEFVSALESEGRLLDEGFPLPKYDVEGHLKWMNEAGIETSVLTLAAPQPSSPQEANLLLALSESIRGDSCFVQHCRCPMLTQPFVR